MIKQLLLSVFTLFAINIFAQTTFTFEGSGNWDDPTNWESGQYPGNTINTKDIVEILGQVTINIDVTNNGTIDCYNRPNDTPEILIKKKLINNGEVSFSRTKVVIDSDGTIISNIDSKLNIESNSKITNKGNFEIRGDVVISSQVSNIKNDKNINIFSSGKLTIAAGELVNNMMIENAGTIDNDYGIIKNLLVLNNTRTGEILTKKTFSNESGASFKNNGSLIISDDYSSTINKGTFINTGNINVTGKESKLNLYINGKFYNQMDGTINIASDSKIKNSGALFDIQGGKITNDGTIKFESNITISTEGELENNGSLENSFGATLQNNGVLSGIGTSKTFTNAGIFSPGNLTTPTVVYKMEEYYTSYTQTADGVLKIDIGETTDGKFDKIIIERDAALNGTLKVNLLNNFTPAAGDKFHIIKNTRVSSKFTTETLPTLPTGLSWKVNYNDGSYTLPGVVLEVIATAGIEDFTKTKLKLTAYPNPTVDQITVSGLTETSTAIIYDVNGKKVIENTISKDVSSINVEKLNPGVYLLNVNNRTLKFVKK